MSHTTRSHASGFPHAPDTTAERSAESGGSVRRTGFTPAPADHTVCESMPTANPMLDQAARVAAAAGDAVNHEAHVATDPAAGNPHRRSLEVPLHLKPVLNGYAEVAAVGICAERTLRRFIATGRVKQSLIRNGKNLRFVKDLLIDELRQTEE